MAIEPQSARNGEKQTSNLFPMLYVQVQKLMAREEGQDLVEYALLVALIALVSIASVTSLGTVVNSIFSVIAGDLA